MNHPPDLSPIAPVINESESLITQFSPLVFGGFVLILILSNHALYTEIASYIHNRFTTRLIAARKTWLARPVLYFTIILLLASHLVEILIWAYALHYAKLVPDFQSALYFSGSTYTTLGYGSDIMPQAWNAITAVIALSGMFSIAWTTSSLLSMLGVLHPFSFKKHPTEPTAHVQS